MDAANLLKPMLARGKLRCIGATTLNEVSLLFSFLSSPRLFDQGFLSFETDSRLFSVCFRG